MPKTLLQFSDFYQTQILLKISYDGRNYSGMAYNNDDTISVETVILKTLVKLCLIPSDFTLKNINFSRCGRTDKGVSAVGNYICLAVFLKQHSKPLKIASKLNSLLPLDIRILNWAQVSPIFNARFNCNMRIYKYTFFEEDFSLHLMREGCEKLEGKHDFRNFCKIKVLDNRTYMRRIFSCTIKQTEIEGLREIEIRGSAFLRQQIRYIVNILFLIGRKLEKPEVIDFLLDLDQCPSKPTFGSAPPEPLILKDCRFDGRFVLEFRAEEEGVFYEKNELRRLIESLREKKLIELNYLNSLLDYMEGKKIGEPPSVRSTDRGKKYVPVKELLRDSSVEEKIASLSEEKKLIFYNKYRLR